LSEIFQTRLNSVGKTAKGEPLRFLREVVFTSATDDCVRWLFSTDRTGHAQVWVKGRLQMAARYVCMVTRGDPPSGEHQAAHSCGNGHEGCLNPRHIQWKTVKENHADKIEHGTDQRGERSNFAKLTNVQATEIMNLKGQMPQRMIAALYGVHPSQVSHIHTGANWAWLHETK